MLRTHIDWHKVNKKMARQKGFTLLELLVTIAILSIVFVVGARTSMTNMSKSKSAQNTAKLITDTLSIIKNQSLSRNTSSKVIIVNTAGIYTMNTYISTTPITCGTAATWTLLTTSTISVNAAYQITGNGMAGTCFYRDGSSSGGTFVVSAITPTSETKTTTIDVTISTGFLDVTTN
jgi:prepilin-type N-terminal cleavage/methylation domain-containing protein